MFNSFFPKKNHAIYEIVWKNMVQPDTPHGNLIRHMRFACWIPKTINTYSEYVIPI